ncbi:MAG: energy transducer TonB [Pyrinomonadaceae bacterium]
MAKHPTVLTFILFVLLFYPFFDAAAQDTQAKMLSGSEFVLSDEARAAGFDGIITVNFTVDKSGAAKNINILAGPAWPCGSSSKGIDKVRDAVKINIAAAKFSPAMKDGKPAEADLQAQFAIGDAYRKAIKQKEAEAAAPNSPAPKLIDAGVLTGKAISLPKPDYSSAARASRVSGPVPVQLVFDEQGKVILAGAIGGNPLLQESARTSACKAKFEPVLLSNKPVKVSGVLVYNFVP